MSFQPEETIGKYASSAGQLHDLCSLHVKKTAVSARFNIIVEDIDRMTYLLLIKPFLDKGKQTKTTG